jgi:hypothetical protein
LGKVFQIEEGQVRKHIGKAVLGMVEETLNKLLDAAADQLCGAARNEWAYVREDARAISGVCILGHVKRS